MYELAEVLHKTVAEIGQMSAEEFQGWKAHFKLRKEAREAG